MPATGIQAAADDADIPSPESYVGYERAEHFASAPVQVPANPHGMDIDSSGTGVIREQRLYQLMRQPGDIGEHTFVFELLDADAQAYAFTCG